MSRAINTSGRLRLFSAVRSKVSVVTLYNLTQSIYDPCNRCKLVFQNIPALASFYHSLFTIYGAFFPRGESDCGK